LRSIIARTASIFGEAILGFSFSQHCTQPGGVCAMLLAYYLPMYVPGDIAVCFQRWQPLYLFYLRQELDKGNIW